MLPYSDDPTGQELHVMRVLQPERGDKLSRSGVWFSVLMPTKRHWLASVSVDLRGSAHVGNTLGACT